MAVKTYLQAISDGLRDEMRRDARVFLIGEDIGVYGGAFKVTQGFQAEFGEDRVIDSPLSETAIVGACTGAALMGMRPVCEMQFSDFVSCAFDQLVTVAAKQHYRVGTPVPIVVRLPSGGGFSGGPFHSQNPEGFFAHCPGLKIVCPATPADAKGLIVQAIRDPNPVLFFEHKHLYRRIKGEVPDGEHTVEFGKARIHREGSDLRSSPTARWCTRPRRPPTAVAERDGTSVEIIDLRTITPWDKQAVLDSVAKTGKVIVLHEDTHTSGFGAEIAATIAEEAFENLDAPVVRHHRPRHPRALLAAAREGVPPPGGGRRGGDRESCPPTEEPPPMATGTLVDVVMPQMGVSVSEGTITRWAKQVGEHDRGRRDDRRDLDRQGRHRGAVAGVRRRPRDPGRRGRTVPVNTRIAVIDTGGDAAVGGAARRAGGRRLRRRQAAGRRETARAGRRQRRRRAPARARRRRRGERRRRRRLRAARSSARWSRACWPSTASTSTRSPAPAAAAA